MPESPPAPRRKAIGFMEIPPLGRLAPSSWRGSFVPGTYRLALLGARLQPRRGQKNVRCAVRPLARAGARMAEYLTTSELVGAQARRSYWRAKHEEALTANDFERAAEALKGVRLYDWLLDGMEAAQAQ
jgi:hypothetical protein